MLVLFDLDNTLADRSGAVADWIDEFCATEGLGVEDAAWILELDDDGYRDRVDAFTQLRARFSLTDPVETLVGEYRQRIVQLARPVPEATNCLAQLRSAGHALAIVTNGSSGQQHAKIDTLGFRELVDAVIVSGDLGIKKPDPRIFELAAEQTGCRLDDAWMVGDSALHDLSLIHI